MPISKYLREIMVKGVVAEGTLPTSAYLALSTAPISADGQGIVEPIGNGYARKQIGQSGSDGGRVQYFPSSATYDELTDTFSYINNVEIHFNEATGSWGTITHFAIFTALTGGTMLAFGQLTAPIEPVADSVPVIRVGNLVITDEVAA